MTRKCPKVRKVRLYVPASFNLLVKFSWFFYSQLCPTRHKVANYQLKIVMIYKPLSQQ